MEMNVCLWDGGGRGGNHSITPDDTGMQPLQPRPQRSKHQGLPFCKYFLEVTL